MTNVETEAHIEALQRDGKLLAAASARAGLDVGVPPCPGWRVRDVVKHTGHVHRWAGTHVLEERPERVPAGSEEELLSSGPADDELLDWFIEGHERLVGALRSADPEMRCWTFLAAPSPRAFWARRQAHETAIHRSDAESALGPISPFDPAFASDGIDELVMGFAPTPRAKVRLPERRVIQVEATDAGGRWLLGLGPDGVDSARGAGPHDCRLAGTASDLYLFLWNRMGLETSGIQATGATKLLALWRDDVRVRW
jgi:uncharacterized protein (TIGR03083 family)